MIKQSASLLVNRKIKNGFGKKLTIHTSKISKHVIKLLQEIRKKQF